MVGYVLAAGIPVLLIGLFVYGYLANFEMNAKCRSEYEVILPEAACKEPVRLVFLTDLHGWIYGKENEKLLRQVAQGKPDLICIGGDMTVKEGEGCKSALSLCSRLMEMAPVYYAMGNHEIRMPEYERIGKNWRCHTAKPICLMAEKFHKVSDLWLGSSAGMLSPGKKKGNSDIGAD